MSRPSDTSMTGTCEWCGTLTDSDRCAYCGGPRTKAAPRRPSWMDFYVAAPAFDYTLDANPHGTCIEVTTVGQHRRRWVCGYDCPEVKR